MNPLPPSPAPAQIVPAVTELIVAELLYLNFDSPEKPVYFYINSTGSQARRPPPPVARRWRLRGGANKVAS